MRRRLRMMLIPALVFAFVLNQSACNKQSTLSAAKEVVAALTEVKPLLETLGLPADKINTAIDYGNKLVAALENPAGGTGDPKALAAGLIHAFEEVVAQTSVISDPRKKVLILAILGIANIALHHIADNVTETPAARASAGPAVLVFKAKPVWRCRSSQTGQYRKMEYCKAHPDVSTVETQ